MSTEVPGYVSKTDLVAALIRELVITGELAPGEQLRQRDLAQRFGVSQTPVREAMRRLLSDGLLGYAWPKYVRSGEQSEFRVHAVEQYKLALWRSAGIVDTGRGAE